MAVYSLLFGHVEWPEEPTRPDPLAGVHVEPERPARVTVSVPPLLKRRLEESAELAGVPSEVFVQRALARSVDPRVEAWT